MLDGLLTLLAWAATACALVVVLLNVRGAPLAWHIQLLFHDLLLQRLSALAVRSAWLPMFRAPPGTGLTRADVVPQLKATHVFPGTVAFALCISKPGRVWPNLSDYNLHMSNSSYASVMDSSRMHFLVRFFPRLFSDGGLTALGGTDYTFHAEVPLMAPFQVETSILAWDEKWLYLMGQFVSPARQGKPKKIYCTALSRYCIKAARRTVPPWLLIATHGYDSEGLKSWEKAESLRADFQAQAAAQKGVKSPHHLPRNSIWLGSGPKLGTLYQAFFNALDAEKAGTSTPEASAWTKPEAWGLAGLESQRLVGIAQLSGRGGHFTLSKAE